MRQLKKRERESLGEPTWLRSIEAPTTLADLEAGRTDGHGRRAGRARARNTRRAPRTSPSSDPERVAQQIRTWMQED